MEITVLVEPAVGNGFRAVSGEPLHLVADAPTRDQAIEKLQGLIAGRLRSGAEVVRLKISPIEHPLAPFAGGLRDDPLLEPWKQAIGEYRQQDASPGNNP